MNMSLLDIQPRTLQFVVDLKKQSSCVVQLTNITHHYAAFKVKTTSPKKYCVRPNVGVVAPKSSCEFTVIMQAFKEPPPNMVCKDKFLVQCVTVPAGTADEDITAGMFSKMEGKLIEENKLRVTLVLPSDSPELSPLNGTPKQEAVFENSILKDRLYSLSETLAPPQYEGEIVKEPRMIGHDEVKTSKVSTEDFTEDSYTANDLKTTKDGESEITATNSLDAPMKTAMDLPRDQGFTNGITSAELNIRRDRDVVQLQNINSLDEFKLVKDIEDMKLIVDTLESKIKQADSTISKLIEERSISSQHRESLQHELAEMKTKKIVKEVHIGFPLLFVCVVAFISIVIGYCLRT